MYQHNRNKRVFGEQPLKVSPKLDKRYSNACKLCSEKHKAIYGKVPDSCAFRSFDNEYCDDITTAERMRIETEESTKPDFKDYARRLFNGHSTPDSYYWIDKNFEKLSKKELCEIIFAFEYGIYSASYYTYTEGASKYINEYGKAVYRSISKEVERIFSPQFNFKEEL